MQNFNKINRQNNFLFSAIFCPTFFQIIITKIGKVNGLENITKLTNSGWSNRAAINYQHGYIVRIEIDGRYTYGRLYVTNDTSAGTEVKYQYPF